MSERTCQWCGLERAEGTDHRYGGSLDPGRCWVVSTVRPKPAASTARCPRHETRRVSHDMCSECIAEGHAAGRAEAIAEVVAWLTRGGAEHWAIAEAIEAGAHLPAKATAP